MVPTFATMPSLPQPAPKALWGVHYDQLTEEEKFWAYYTENSAVMCGYRSMWIDVALQPHSGKSLKVSVEGKFLQWVILYAMHLVFIFLHEEMAGCTMYTNSWVLTNGLAAQRYICPLWMLTKEWPTEENFNNQIYRMTYFVHKVCLIPRHSYLTWWAHVLPSSMDLENFLSTIKVLHTALPLINDFTSQQMKCHNESMLMEFTGLTLFPTIMKQLAWQNVGMTFAELVIVHAK